MRRSDFEFPLPPELIAQIPLPQRSASRLLELDGARSRLQDRQFNALPQCLRSGDLLVFNDTRVLPARLAGRRESGGRVEILLERPLEGHAALIQLRASNRLHEGEVIRTPGGALVLRHRHQDLWEAQLPEAPIVFFERWGSVPLPPYITRPPDERDRERYQSVLARVPGAVAAPTASLHFDLPLLEALAACGISRSLVTLHVGVGTFQPLRAESLDAHVMHAEWYAVPDATVRAIAATRRAGGRVIAVGTTVVRCLESAALAAAVEGGVDELHAGTGLRAGTGDTRLFIRPGFRFQVVDGLVTNFHLPGSTLLMLVSAFAGHAAMRAAYAHAVEQRYRFFSYGDAMLVWPGGGAHT